MQQGDKHFHVATEQFHKGGRIPMGPNPTRSD